LACTPETGGNGSPTDTAGAAEPPRYGGEADDTDQTSDNLIKTSWASAISDRSHVSGNGDQHDLNYRAMHVGVGASVTADRYRVGAWTSLRTQRGVK
jgi:hypothetical protein